MYKKGFGLLELLITLVILAILSGFLYPSFIAAKENSKRSADASQIQQLLKAYTMYVGDHEGQVPFATYSSTSGRTSNAVLQETRLPPRDNYVTWVVFLYPYLKSKEIFWSPASNINQGTFTDASGFNTSSFVCYPSWGYNGCYFSVIGNGNIPSPRSTSIPINECLIEEPSSTLVFANSTSKNHPRQKKLDDLGNFLIIPPSSSNEWQAKDKDPVPSTILYNHYGYLYPRFKNKTICNVGFADGHVKGVSIKELSQEKIWQIKKDPHSKWNQ